MVPWTEEKSLTEFVLLKFAELEVAEVEVPSEVMSVTDFFWSSGSPSTRSRVLPG